MRYCFCHISVAGFFQVDFRLSAVHTNLCHQNMCGFLKSLLFKIKKGSLICVVELPNLTAEAWGMSQCNLCNRALLEIIQPFQTYWALNVSKKTRPRFVNALKDQNIKKNVISHGLAFCCVYIRHRPDSRRMLCGS